MDEHTELLTYSRVSCLLALQRLNNYPSSDHTHSPHWSELWRMYSKRSDVGGGRGLLVRVLECG